MGERMSVRLVAVISFCVAVTSAGTWLPNLHARTTAAAKGGPVGMFEDHTDVGKVLHPGTTEYDANAKTYTITGSGNNMWMTEDDFQFAWKKMSGDVTLEAKS